MCRDPLLLSDTGLETVAEFNRLKIDKDLLLRARNLAEQTHALRLIYAAKLEEIFENSVWLKVTSESGACEDLRTAEELLDFIYSRNDIVPVQLMFYRSNSSHAIDSIFFLWDVILLDSIRAFMKDAFTLSSWERFRQELLDSLNNEIISFYARLNIENSIRSAHHGELNFWKWVTQNPYRQRWLQDNNHDLSSFLLQVGSFSGHRAHPSSKMKMIIDPKDPSIRKPLSAVSISIYSPEFARNVALQIIAIKAIQSTTKLSALSRDGEKVVEETETEVADNYLLYFKESFPEIYETWKAALASQVGGDRIDEFVPIPIHPLQIPEIKYRFAQDIACGDIIFLPDVTVKQRPTISFRTLTPVNRENEPQIKTSINMQMTSVVRTLAPARAFNAPVLSDTLGVLLRKDTEMNGVLRILREPAAIYWGTNDDPEAKDYKDGYHLGAVFKDNPTLLTKSDEICIPLNTLLSASPFSGERILTDLMRSKAIKTKKEVLSFFQEYVGIVVKSDVGMLVKYGISLESHQQNIDIVFDFYGKPRAMVYRDINGGLEIFEPMLRLNGYDLRSKIHSNRKGLLDSIDLPLQQTMHTTLASHVFAVISVISKTYDVPKKFLLNIMHELVEIEVNCAKLYHLPPLFDKLPADKALAVKEKIMQAIYYVERGLLGHEVEIKCLTRMRINQLQENIFKKVTFI